MSPPLARSAALIVAAAVSLTALPHPASADEPLGRRLMLLAQSDEPPPREPRTATPPPPPPRPAEDDERPIYKTWWFWALTAAVVGGTVALGVAMRDTSGPRPPRACPMGVIACFGDGRSP